MRFTEIEQQYDPRPGDIWSRSYVLKALQQLEPDERRLIIAFVEVGSGRGLADIYGVPRETTRCRINRALKKLRKILEEHELEERKPKK